MILNAKKKFLSLLILLVTLFAFNNYLAWAQEESTTTITKQSGDERTTIQECIDQGKVTRQQCLDYLNSKHTELKNQVNSLEDQLTVMDNQIKLTEYKIELTKEEILSLEADIDTTTKKIGKLENSLNDLTKVLLDRIVATYIAGSVQPFHVLLSSDNATNFFTKLNYLKIVQVHDKKLIYDTEQAKVDYSNQKNIFEDKKQQELVLKKQFEAYSSELDQQKADKQRLLDQTQGSEQSYQNLLAQAKAELAGYSSFVSAAGGGLTTFGSGSNGWYYTQRDPQWGNMTLPGSSSTVLLAGCAVTSVAMVCRSYGQGITPASIASNTSKFIGGDLWNWAFSCDGKTTEWIGSSQDQVKSYVQNGTPVILRLIAPSVSGLHFIVAWKWDGGDFIIHDPYYGPDKKFSDRYSWDQVTTAIVIH
jgi:peptidoglycan hydrolase CwlO-like protein